MNALAWLTLWLMVPGAFVAFGLFLGAWLAFGREDDRS